MPELGWKPSLRRCNDLVMAGVWKALGLRCCTGRRLAPVGCSLAGSGRALCGLGPFLTDWGGLEELRSNGLKPRAPFLGRPSFFLILNGLSAESAVPLMCCEASVAASVG